MSTRSWHYDYNGIPPEDDHNDYRWTGSQWVVDNRTDEDDDLDVDVCQHCGSYFAWTPHHAEVAQKTGFKGQRCIRCMTDECWIEGRFEDVTP